MSPEVGDLTGRQGGGGCSVAKLCLTLCDPMGCSTPGFPVLHYLPKFAQTHGRPGYLSKSCICMASSLTYTVWFWGKMFLKEVGVEVDADYGRALSILFFLNISIAYQTICYFLYHPPLSISELHPSNRNTGSLKGIPPTPPFAARPTSIATVSTDLFQLLWFSTLMIHFNTLQ